LKPSIIFLVLFLPLLSYLEVYNVPCGITLLLVMGTHRTWEHGLCAKSTWCTCGDDLFADWVVGLRGKVFSMNILITLPIYLTAGSQIYTGDTILQVSEMYFVILCVLRKKGIV
jgi:hypothetical protein